ncbi:2TM domain-containing protein [Flavobacterium buctense]|uniref:2TM domain-containing protein n=1 Tax=Flavobacterium buctense TaxID=1648146 RepID=A0ABU9E298_9FLAO|nr:2TM domain-containing protein [Flavobacterium buctense]
MENLDEIKYQEAVKRVQKIKGFYSHLAVYVLISLFIVVKKTQKIDEGETIWHAFYVPFFWGIGVIIHALNVFDKLSFLGYNWEEKKIREYMEKENKRNKFE